MNQMMAFTADYTALNITAGCIKQQHCSVNLHTKLCAEKDSSQDGAPDDLLQSHRNNLNENNHSQAVLFYTQVNKNNHGEDKQQYFLHVYKLRAVAK